MKFNLRAMEPDAQDQQNPLHHSLSSSYHLFSQQPITVGQDMIRRRFEIRERIKREIEKEMIRQEIIAEEMARRRVLEAEVRNELMMERHVAMRRAGGGFAAPFMRPSHEEVFLQPRLFGADDKDVMSADEKFGRGDGFCGIRGVSVKPIQVLGDSTRIKAIAAPLSEHNNKEVIVLGKPDDGTLSGTKRKSKPVSEGSSQPGPPGSDRSRKKVKEEWSCAICQVSTTSERGLTQHIQGKKHQVKEAALVAQKTGANVGLGVAPKIPLIKPARLALTTIYSSSSETNKPSSSSDPNEVNKKDVMDGKSKGDKFKFWCEMCQVGAFSEAVMNDHKEGKKHSTRVVEFYQKGKVDSEASATENTCDSKDKSKNKSNLEVVIATVAAEVKTVEDNMAYVAAAAAEESYTTTTG